MQRRAYTSFVLHHPWKTILACLTCMLFIGYFLKNVAPSVSYKDMLGENYPLLKIYEKMQREYTNDDNLLLLIENKQGSVFNPQILSEVQQLTTALWQTPYSVRVDSLTNFQHTEANGDELVVADLVQDPLSLSKADLQKIQAVAVAEPQLLNRAVNPEGNVLAINISFSFPNKALNEKLDADQFVQDAVQVFRQKMPQTRAYVAGLVALDATVMKISQQESGMFLVLILGIVIFALMCLLRAFGSVLVIVLVVIFSVVACMAFSGMMGWKLTPFTASVPMMILVLAVADSVHIISAFVQNLKQGLSKHQAIEKALTLNIKPIAITSVTTAIGFLTLNFSDSESIGALGSQVAFGVICAFMLSISFLPAMLCILPVKAQGKTLLSRNSIAPKMAALVVRFNGVIVLISIMLSGGLSYFIAQNVFNDTLPEYFAESLPWRQANDFSEQQFGSAYTFSYSLSSSVADGVSQPEFLADIQTFVTWLRNKPEVAHVNSITDTFKRLNRSLHGDNSSFYTLPKDKRLAAQYLLLYEMSLPYGLDLNNQINIDKSATKVIVTFRSLSTKRTLQLEQEIDTWLASNVPNIKAQGAGVQLMFAHLLDKDTKGLIWGAVIGLLMISLLLIMAFKSIKVGLISILPNIVPVAVAFGIWGLLVGQVGMGMAMVSGITIGIVVDDTVHFLYKYLDAKRQQRLSTQEAIQYAYQHAGVAILLTTVVLVAGFMSMALLSEFRVNSDMGKMACIVMIAALIIDLFTLPAILAWLDGEKSLHTRSPNLTSKTQELL